MPYEVPPLPYDYAALEPHIDEATMRVHHDKHHQAYVDKVNAALDGTEWADKPIEQVIESPPDPRRQAHGGGNNGGGHINHTSSGSRCPPTGRRARRRARRRDQLRLRLLRRLST